MFTPNRLRFHYENLLHQDLLLKLNYANIMEVPRLCKIIVVPKAPSNLIRNVKLAMEIICSQKFTQTQSRNSTRRSFRFNKFVLNRKSKKNTEYVTYLARSTLRGHTMYNFLEKLVTIISFYDYPVKIQRNSIQLSMAMLLLRLFPEIQNHFEIFEHIRGFDITIVTSANTQDETFILWSGFYKKRFSRMSNQIVRDHTRRLLVARYELERMQCKAISRHQNLPNQIRYEYFLKSSKLPRNSSKT